MESNIAEKCPNKIKIHPIYHPISAIPLDHWALQPEPEFCVAILEVEPFMPFTLPTRFLIKLNPTDRRGYRIIVQYIGFPSKGKINSLDAQMILTTLNRDMSVNEWEAITHITGFLAYLYNEIFDLIPQIVFAGNNSHEQIESNKILIGRKEPSMLHAHIFGRGDPETCYFPGLPLDAPQIGTEFNLQGVKNRTTENMTAHLCKLSWADYPTEFVAFKSKLYSIIYKYTMDRIFPRISIVK